MGSGFFRLTAVLDRVSHSVKTGLGFGVSGFDVSAQPSGVVEAKETDWMLGNSRLAPIGAVRYG